ncbi:CBO0543 family protein [Paenibacillus arenilitoris]|uniref:Uncharacterized protein n=1 Tax=Paenibacillus arenilitoris TaxID=2772299 RepID=A0A927CQ12_9BACL|nr:CBO0543 family protein [Paenibacillus arenilitoris]MBD2871410.1 hypothetical protein [Paenibacillus arenilitoris]
MYLVTNALFFAALFVTGAAKKWRAHYATMIYIAFCNLLYSLLCDDYLLWSFHPAIFKNHKTIDLLNTFVLLPSTTLLYLVFYPTRGSRKLAYYLSWIAGFSLLEYVWKRFGYITYGHGWNYYWSVAFYFAMFFSLRLHHTKLALALLFSAVTVVLLLVVFKVPVLK